MNKTFLLRTLIGLALSVLSGIAFTLAFPPYELWLLAWVGWVPVLIAQYRIMPRRLSGLATAVAIFVWLQGYLGPVFAPIGTFMVYLPLIAGAISLLADGGNRQFAEGTRYRWMLPAIIAGWSGSEMIRLFIPIAGTWAFIAYPLYRQVWLIQPASIFGIIGVGALIMLINGTLALILIAWLDTRWHSDPDTPPIPRPLVRGWFIGSAAALGAWIILSLILLRPMDTPKVTVAAIQPEISPILTASLQGEDAQSEVAKVHAAMLNQSRQAAAQGAQFIVWSEGAMLFDPQVEDRLNLRAFTAETGAHLAVGYIVVLPDKTFRNEATVINPQGEFLGVFGKDHPVYLAAKSASRAALTPCMIRH